MRNRPGRVYYMLDFKGLEQDFIIEYCDDNLKNKGNIPGVCKVASLFDQFNFDMLKAMVEEMNRYDETAQQTMKMLNTRPEFSGEAKYKVGLQIDGLDVPEDKADTEWHGNPLTQVISVDYKVYEDIPNEDGKFDFDWECARFTNEDLKQVDSQTGKFTFINEDGERVTLSKVREKGYHWDAF
jgi:hypothetical protein